jgi:signal transduction histidine kinase
VKRAVALIAASHPGVSWDLVSDGASPDMPLSSASFAETLEIFLRNAVEAMDGQGKGSIETWVADAQLHVAIRDEGVGLDPADLSEIFKPGFTTKPNGSGYGLFLARRIIEEHGGQVTARPREKRGAMVELCLPLRDVASPRVTES